MKFAESLKVSGKIQGFILFFMPMLIIMGVRSLFELSEILPKGLLFAYL